MDATEVPAGSIVVGIDGSPWSDAALTWAADQAALEQRQLTIVHALQPISLPASGVMAGSTGIDYGQVLAEERDFARAMLTNASELALAHHRELTVNGVLSFVDPRGVLLGLAETASMVVLIIGTPTHGFSLRRPRARVAAGGSVVTDEWRRMGLLGWLTGVQPTGAWPSLALYDTRVAAREGPARSVAHRAIEVALERGFTSLHRPAKFLVLDNSGPLWPGEVERAAEWGVSLGASPQQAIAVPESVPASR